MTTPMSPENRPDRRAVLKGAVAAGVGAAAWVAPDISTLGFTPAYAQTCSAPATYVSDGSGVNCPAAACAGGTQISLAGSVRLSLQGGGASQTRVRAAAPNPRCADGGRTFEIFGIGGNPPDLDCQVLSLTVAGQSFPVTGNVVPEVLQSSPGTCDGPWVVTASCCPAP